MSDADRCLLLLARTRGHTPSSDRLVSAFSRLGEHGGVWLAVGAIGWALERDGERRRAWRRGIATVVAAYGANQALKLAVRRRRPQLAGLPPLTATVSQLSFPSAHATTSFAAARAYGALAPPAVLYPAAVALAASRTYLGVHYPTDVLAGALLGTLVAVAR